MKNRMKNLRVSEIFIGVFLLFFLPDLVYAKPLIEFTKAELEYLDKKKEIIVLCDHYFPPFEFEDANTKKMTGFGVELVETVSKVLGIKPVFKPMRWEKAIPALLNKDGDIICGIIHTPKRLEIIDFSIPYLSTSRNIFVLKGNPLNIKKLEDLTLKKVAVQKGDVCEEIVKKNVSSSIIFTDNQKDGILYLNNKLVDAFVGNKYVGVYLMNTLKLKNISILDGNVAASDFCIGLNKDNELLKSILNKAINSLKLSSEYDNIYNKWFSLNEKKGVQFGKIIFISVLTLFIFAIIFAISLIWIFTLKKAIKHQTKKINSARNELLEQNRKIIDTNEQLKKLDTMKDNFVSNVSHELRTPLVSILGYINLLEEKKLGELNEKQLKAVGIIDKNINKLLGIINSLLDITRSEEKMFKEKREFVDLTQMIDNSIALYEPMTKARNISIEFLYDKTDRFLLESHKQLLEIIINNLITNAIKYNKENGSIFIELTKSENEIILSVRDTGIGIDKIHLTKIFDRFYQVDNKITSNSGGFGIGLYLIKKYSAVLKCKIELKSEFGKGSEFILTFNIINGEKNER